ncbi:Plasmid stabilization system protein [Bacteroidales bacterium Barb6XT]|nr:Plasmid stabilization system protein [Bacteroidales bacterium Barb6XT]
MYKIIISNKIKKALDKIPPSYLFNIKNAVNGLSNNPRPFGYCELPGSDNKYRIRIGDYRVIYSIKKNILTVEVIKIDHRSGVYRS